MGTKYNILNKNKGLTVGLCLILCIVTDGYCKRSNVGARTPSQLTHTKELLGAGFELTAAPDPFIHQTVFNALEGLWKGQARKLATTILEESRRNDLDPILVMAVIQHESLFKPLAMGAHGEIGLMQIRPQTAAWLAKKLNMKWTGANSLRDLQTNIKFGAAYIAYLKKHFSPKGQLYLAAYNMGGSNVRKALRKQISPKTYSTKVMAQYFRFYDELTSFEIAPNNVMGKSYAAR